LVTQLQGIRDIRRGKEDVLFYDLVGLLSSPGFPPFLRSVVIMSDGTFSPARIDFFASQIMTRLPREGSFWAAGKLNKSNIELPPFDAATGYRIGYIRVGKNMVHIPFVQEGLFQAKNTYYKGPVKVPFKWSDSMIAELDAAVVANSVLIKQLPLGAKNPGWIAVAKRIFCDTPNSFRGTPLTPKQCLDRWIYKPTSELDLGGRAVRESGGTGDWRGAPPREKSTREKVRSTKLH